MGTRIGSLKSKKAFSGCLEVLFYEMVGDFFVVFLRWRKFFWALG